MRGEGLGVHAESAMTLFYLFEDVIAPFACTTVTSRICESLIESTSCVRALKRRRR